MRIVCGKENRRKVKKCNRKLQRKAKCHNSRPAAAEKQRRRKTEKAP
jgi:hypothetical protein